MALNYSNDDDEFENILNKVIAQIEAESGPPKQPIFKEDAQQHFQRLWEDNVKLEEENINNNNQEADLINDSEEESEEEKVIKEEAKVIFKNFNAQIDEEKIKAIKNNGLNLAKDPTLVNNKEIVKIAVRQNPDAFQFAGENLKSDRKFIEELLKIEKEKESTHQATEHSSLYSKSILKHVPYELRNDVSFMRPLINANPKLLEYAGPNIQDNALIVLEAVQNNGLVLEHASEKLRKDDTIVLAAVTQNGMALRFGSKSLRASQPIVLTAIKNTPDAVVFAENETLKSMKIDKAVRVSITEHLLKSHGWWNKSTHAQVQKELLNFYKKGNLISLKDLLNNKSALYKTLNKGSLFGKSTLLKEAQKAADKALKEQDGGESEAPR